MEKEYFIDRSPEGKHYSQVNKGDKVLICEKHMQRIASEKKHLTEGIVQDKLTKRDHPRGIKVRLTNGCVGRVIYLIEKAK